MRTPTIGLLFLVFIGERSLKRATMEVERHHIGSSEGVLGESGQEQLVDDAFTGASDATLLLPSQMGGDDDPTGLAVSSDGHRWTVIERTSVPALRMADLLIGGQMQAGLHLVEVEQVIVLAPGHIRQVSQIDQYRCGAILPIQAHHGAVVEPDGA
jgi:hypothetical protein